MQVGIRARRGMVVEAFGGRSLSRTGRVRNLGSMGGVGASDGFILWRERRTLPRTIGIGMEKFLSWVTSLGRSLFRKKGFGIWM